MRHGRGGVLRRHRRTGGIPRAARRPGPGPRHRSPPAVHRCGQGGDLSRAGVAEPPGPDPGDLVHDDEERAVPGDGRRAAAGRLRGAEPDRFPLRSAPLRAVRGDLLPERDDLLPVGHHAPARRAVPRKPLRGRGPLPRTLRNVVGDIGGVPAGAAGEDFLLPEGARGGRPAASCRRAPFLRPGRPRGGGSRARSLLLPFRRSLPLPR